MLRIWRKSDGDSTATISSDSRAADVTLWTTWIRLSGGTKRTIWPTSTQEEGLLRHPHHAVDCQNGTI